MDLVQALMIDISDLQNVALFLSLSCLPLNFINFRLIYEILFMDLSYCLQYLFFSASIRTKYMVDFLFHMILCSLFSDLPVWKGRCWGILFSPFSILAGRK